MSDRKLISIIVPCFNEEKSVNKMHQIITEIFDKQLSQYDFELIFCDDYSTDSTREILERICVEDPRVKAIFNAKNFGFSRNVFFSLQQGSGDATFLVFGDLQDPPELLPEFVSRWEQGDCVILGQKLKSRENRFVYWMRTVFYSMMDKLSPVKQIQHFNGYGFYDKKFIDVLRKIDDPQPYLKGIVSEFAFRQSILNYEQKESKRGKSNFNFSKYYDVAMQGVTSYTKVLMRIATFIGIILGIISIIIAAGVSLYKFFHWDSYPTGIPTVIVGVFFIGAVQLFFTGILGEYLLGVNTRTMKRPLVVTEKRLNFAEGEEQ